MVDSNPTTEPELVMHEAVHTISIEDAAAMLEEARASVNEYAVDSELRELLNHPDAEVMLENLKEAGIESLIVSGLEADS